jgi:serine/threonine-protein kinase
MEADQLSGRVIDGKYKVDRLLGRGGMGAVYVGTHMQLERNVAVKILRAELVADSNAAARFAREARAAARIEHPNAVNVYDFGQLEGGGAYLVMEYVDGVSLRQVMRQRGPLPLALVVDLVGQIAGAVAAAHARGIIHRDVKPENVMVRTEEDGRLTAKVVDFGLAKLLSGDTLTQLSNQSEIIGTPRYMAPEQFSGDTVDERVDVYAIGVVLYELLAGRTPFEGSFTEIIGKHLYAPPPPLASFDAGVPEEVEQVALRALSKDPAKRQPSAAELARELARAAWSASAGAAEGTRLMPRAAATAPQDFERTREDAIPTARFPGRITDPEDAGLETRYAADGREEETRVRADTPLPTVHVPDGPPAALPAAGGHVAAAPRRNIRVPVAIVLAAAAAVGAALWATSPDTPQQAPRQQAPAAAPPAPPAPPTPKVEANAAPPAEPAPQPAPQPAERPARRAPDRAQDREGTGHPEAPDPDDFEIVIPEIAEEHMTPAERRKLRRDIQRQIQERKRAIDEANKARQKALDQAERDRQKAMEESDPEAKPRKRP